MWTVIGRCVMNFDLLPEDFLNHIKKFTHFHSLVTGDQDCLIGKLLIVRNSCCLSRCITDVNIFPDRIRGARIIEFAGSQQGFAHAINEVPMVRFPAIQASVTKNRIFNSELFMVRLAQ